ncbi:hypothetical protein OJ996_25710 [Luteolibacter sp. GHJ8]|uniref:Phospholipase C accessory protein PlcR n=1 Tax=Luteolibacter rhizosphaerae TaxID=2989719 RepID=A0ABT3GBI9_9BACT|nr:hypothetical protein [Luteolibacter rhizosphaerae]MCW1917012.1 hypothetical protein [Luteolibacter rhizosphaerae]
MFRTRKFLVIFCLIGLGLGYMAGQIFRKPDVPAATETSRRVHAQDAEIRSFHIAKSILSAAERIQAEDSARLEGQAPPASPHSISFRDLHLEEIGELIPHLQELSRDEQAKPLATAAIGLGHTAQELAAARDKIFTALDAGQAADSPELKPLLEQAARLEAAYLRQRELLAEQLDAPEQGTR